MDDSTSEGIYVFQSIKDFVIGLIRDMDVGPDKTSVCLVTVHLNPTVCFAKNRRCESSRVTSPLVVPQSSFTGIEDSLKLAADELFNLQAGAMTRSDQVSNCLL